MKQEASALQQPGQADFKFKKQPIQPGQDGRVDTSGKRNIILPSDTRTLVDFTKDPRQENQLHALAEADSLVNRWLHDERFQPTSQEMQEKFPLTFIHEKQVARGATVLAIRLGAPEIVRMYTSQGGIMHDTGKLFFDKVRWDETDWTDEEKIDNKYAVENHSLKSAEKTKGISPILADIVALHHIFQLPVSYPEPNHPSYQRLLLPENSDAFFAARLLGLFDHFEASETRSGDGTEVFTDALVQRLQKHKYVSMVGKPEPAYSDDEIKIARETYGLITVSETKKAA